MAHHVRKPIYDFALPSPLLLTETSLMPILFKDAALRPQYSKLHHFNPKLCGILHRLQDMVQSRYHKDIVITQIERGQDENDRIYKNDKTNKHRKTAHGVWAAVDIRSSIFSNTEISEVIAFLNSYNDTNSNPIKGGNTALHHAVEGGVKHIHIQYAPRLKHKSAGV
ncbi:hypothetical protein [Bradyrhizobium elkanii]|uniref:hypothetical protein n=1 Tax=Bradyrhizobium elkanii TaxID=29448 RepID=UPI001AE3B6AE|nr:hypothetical protein [Bradyrhizobium elkanii]MBP2434095.1 hypothetical protein [Bradyrhizobium elkanii]WLA88978.1 hypothetical protein QNJ96_28275 [Bradyrhizobium elkanii]